MRPKGVADAHTGTICSRQKDLSRGTLGKSATQAMVALGVRDRKIVGKCAWTKARKAL